MSMEFDPQPSDPRVAHQNAAPQDAAHAVRRSGDRVSDRAPDQSVEQFFTYDRPQAQQVQTLFDRIAPVYDQLNDQLSAGLHHIWKHMTVDWSGAKPGQRVLDVCCGSGDLAFLLAEAVGSLQRDRVHASPPGTMLTGQVEAIDFSAQLLNVASERARQRSPQPRIHWTQGDALALPFAANEFDAATMGYGLRNLADIPRGLRELHRVLKPGAKAAILDMHRPSSAVMQQVQAWYLDWLVVPAARSLNLTDEYAYIAPSLDRFPTGSEQVQLAKTAGFQHAVHYTLMGGMMGVLVATK